MKTINLPPSPFGTKYKITSTEDTVVNFDGNKFFIVAGDSYVFEYTKKNGWFVKKIKIPTYVGPQHFVDLREQKAREMEQVLTLKFIEDNQPVVWNCKGFLGYRK